VAGTALEKHGVTERKTFLLLNMVRIAEINLGLSKNGKNRMTVHPLR